MNCNHQGDQIIQPKKSMKYLQRKLQKPVKSKILCKK